MLMSHDVNLPSRKRKIEFIRYQDSSLWHVHNHYNGGKENPSSVSYSVNPPEPFCKSCMVHLRKMILSGFLK